ncbi:helix-turn-helix domain-containing protein [Candidatus Enterococcus mangumiae]|uniref:HTH-type transcriptional regulator Rgg C-terminal domain-containing protein n=1 Tax=Candidatus Enterococcus mangumiae TaxID=2230878 RepID=A0ABZ2T092_9ENTE|nr:helix-turn-helix transcriptional regulator [Enterococcus sp. DIV1094]MBO0489878.1 helix-turn-helix transcriptional regulator [Enterococcus sp. DIV1094]
MKTYGRTIKEIRLSKGILLKELIDDQLSMSLLSQFENEKTTISCERFHRLLSKLEVTFDEFIWIQTGNTFSASQLEIIEYVEYMDINSITEWAKLEAKYHELQNYYQDNYSLELDHLLQLFRFDLAMKKGIIEGTPLLTSYQKHSHYLDSAKHYLLNTETWGVYELKLFTRIAVGMEPALLFRCLKLAIKKGQRFAKISGNKDILYQTFPTIFSVFCLLKEVAYAKDTFELWKTLIFEEERIEQAVFMPFYEGWIAFLEDDLALAHRLMDQSLNHLESLGMLKSLTGYRKFKQLILTNEFPGIIVNDPLFGEFFDVKNY